MIDLDAALSRAYAHAAGTARPGSAHPLAEVRAALATGDLDRAEVERRRDALRAVSARCVVSKLQAQFLDMVLA